MRPSPHAITTRIEASRPGRGEDRIALVETADRTIIIVADGAGGVAGGAAAAEALCRAPTLGASAWSVWLSQQDAALAAKSTGLAAAVILAIDDDGMIHGASVGDCEAWVFTKNEALPLTDQQVRKPLLGDGAALPVNFTARVTEGTVLIASDGLWKYMKPARIAEAAALRPLESAVDALVAGARLPSGAMQDDIAIVIFEMRRP